MAYLVRCADCDRAFWQDARDEPVPEHGRWERRTFAHHDTGTRCDGSGGGGVWVAEGGGLLPIRGYEDGGDS